MKDILNPDAIAVIGASNKPGKIGNIILNGLARYNKPLYLVHKNHKQICGIKTFPDIKSLPDDIDLAIIATGAEKSVIAAEECAEHGIGKLIVVAGGFGETGMEGKKLEEKLKAIPKKYKTRILGPNTLGIFHPLENFDTIFVEHGDISLAGGGGTAFISQSGSVGVEAMGLAGNTGFGLRGFVGLGNKCDLDELDFLLHYAKDKKTTCIAFYLENITRARQFMEQAKKASMVKPVVVLKAGRTISGSAAASSHTGRMAGSDRVVSGAFRQFGIQRAFDDEELCDAAKALATLPVPEGNRTAIISPAGGYGVMGADHVEFKKKGIKLRMAKFGLKTMDEIRKISFPFASCSNPVDLTASATNEMMGKTVELLIADKHVDIIICTAFFAPPAISEKLIDEIASRVKYSHKPVIVFTQYGPFTDKYLLKFHDKGVTGFPSISRAVRAARFLYERSLILKAFREDNAQENNLDSEKNNTMKDEIKIEEWISNLKKANSPDEYETKLFLSFFGINIPRTIRISCDSDLTFSELKPPFVNPVCTTFVIKVCSSDIMHKTEEKGVMLNIKLSDLGRALDTMMLRFPDYDILLEEQVQFTGPEFIIGAVNDPDYGVSIMAGAGGIMTEIYQDAGFRLAPCSVKEAERMLDELTISPVLHNYRGIMLDRNKLAMAVSSAGRAALCLGKRFSQLDINPIVFSGKKWVALDANIYMK